MSTKFYNAFILKDIATLQDIVEWNKSMTSLIKQEQRNLYGKLIMTALSDSIDRKTVKLFLDEKQKEIIKNKKNPIRTIVDQIEETTKKAETDHYRSPDFDLSCSILYIPYKNNTVIKIFAEQKSYLEIISKELNDFSYWNSTDKPAAISQKEWNERKNFVNSLGNMPLSTNGLSNTLTTDIRYLTFYREEFPELLKLQPSLQDRSLKIAKALDLKDFDEIANKEVKEYLKNDQISLAFDKLNDYLRSEKSKENIKKHLKSLKLKDFFTEEDLIKKD